MPRHARHEPAVCCSCCYGCDGGYAPAPCYYPAPASVPTPCYYPAPVPVPAASTSSTSDHLVQAIVAQLLLGSSAPAPAPAPAPQPQPQPPPPAAHHAANPYPYTHQYQYQHQQQEAKSHVYAHPPPAPQQQQHQHQSQPNSSDNGRLLLHSLLRRVAALESALPRCIPHPAPPRRAPHPNPRPRRAVRHQEFVEGEDADEESESESSPPSPPPPPHRRPPRRLFAREELAARTIQAHFRRFLARRSRTLRQLKELAVLRSKAAALRGSLSGQRRGGVDPAAVSEAAMGLLFRLDAIQGGDPMIREGRRAVSRELTRILEFVDKVLVKEHEQLSTGNGLDNYDYHEGCSAEFVSNLPAANTKKVSFSGNGRVHEKLHGETGNVKEVDEGSESSGSAESDEVKGLPAKRNANGKPGLAAPTPVHMETRKVARERR